MQKPGGLRRSRPGRRRGEEFHVRRARQSLATPAGATPDLGLQRPRDGGSRHRRPGNRARPRGLCFSGAQFDGLEVLQWTIVTVFAVDYLLHFYLAADKRAFLLNPWRIVDLGNRRAAGLDAASRDR